LTSLADRVREIVGRPAVPAPARSDSGIPDPPLSDGASDNRDPQPAKTWGANLESVDLAPLGGVWCDRCFVVERFWEPSVAHGRETIGTLGAALNRSAPAAALFANAAQAPFVFVDLETTGLNGGAGTHAFLVGCAWFVPDGGFVTRQYLLTRFEDERPLLDAVSIELERAGALVSFNGKSFDAPLLESRFLFHRLEWTGARLPHVDVLHPARRFWGHDAGSASLRFHDSSCSLSALERRLVGAGRNNDVDGFEIPSRYFRFVRSRDARPLVAVLEHNRLDLLTLAALTSRLLHLSEIGPEAAHSAGEALALGRVYMRAGLEARAREAFARCIRMSRAPAGAFDAIRVDAVRALARALRHARHHREAAAYWRTLLDTPGCPSHIAREAIEALAIHHEHRVRDLLTARAFALQSLETEQQPTRARAVQHRIARLDRKLERRSQNLELLDLR
jgi:uncharacterized protein YprB with RNaseH-like and TPR domain